MKNKDNDVVNLYQSYINDPFNMQGIQDQLSLFFDIFTDVDQQQHDQHRHRHPIHHIEGDSNDQHPCYVKSHERFGTSTRSSLSSLSLKSKVNVSSSLKRSSRGPSSSSISCQKRLQQDKEKSQYVKKFKSLFGYDQVDNDVKNKNMISQALLLIEARNRTNFLFNSEVFMIRMGAYNDVAYDENNLIPSSTTSRQNVEQTFVQQLLDHKYKPYICGFAFTLYQQHADDKNKHKNIPRSDKSSRSFYNIINKNFKEFQMSTKYDNKQQVLPVVIGMATSNHVKSSSAGDIITAQELANSLKLKYSNVIIKMLQYDDPQSDWYDVDGVDILIVLLDYYDVSLIYNDELHLIKIAWLRNWFSRWLSHSYIGNYDILLTASSVSKEVIMTQLSRSSLSFPVQCTVSTRCPHVVSQVKTVRNMVNIEVFRIATNHHLFKPKSHQQDCIISIKGYIGDYVFTGSYYDVDRDIMMLNPNHSKLSNLSGKNSLTALGLSQLMFIL